MERLTILIFKLFKIIFHQKGILGNFKVRFIKFQCVVAHFITRRNESKEHITLFNEKSLLQCSETLKTRKRLGIKYNDF